MFYWTDKSLLKFLAGKHGAMRIDRINVSDRSYTMGHNKQILNNKMSEEKDIGVVIDNRL